MNESRIWTSIADKERFWTVNAEIFSAPSPFAAISKLGETTQFVHSDQQLTSTHAASAQSCGMANCGQKLPVSTAGLKEQLHTRFGELHTWLGYALYGLFALHVGGALKHQWFDREPELRRMLPSPRVDDGIPSTPPVN